MKKTAEGKWNDPAKRPPKPETMNMQADFGKFTDLMKRVVKAKPREEKSISASHGPDVS
jgi:hypothetical protein